MRMLMMVRWVWAGRAHSAHSSGSAWLWLWLWWWGWWWVWESGRLSCLLCSLLRLLSLDDVGGSGIKRRPPRQSNLASWNPHIRAQNHHHHPGWPTPFHPDLHQSKSSVLLVKTFYGGEVVNGWVEDGSAFFAKASQGCGAPSTPSFTCLIINIIILIIILPQLWISVPTSMWNANVNAGSIQATVVVVGMWGWVDHESFVRFWTGL